MRINIKFVSIIIIFLFLLGDVSAQNIYELRKFTDKDWVKMTTEERLSALNTSMNHHGNQTYMGDFGRYTDLYPRWGYDYYEMEDRYENYAFRGFENYNIINDRRNRWYYNQFGDRLTKMTRTAQIWSETYNDDGTFDAFGPSGYINSQMSPGWVQNVDGIWIARESTDDWALSIVGAGALRTKFTPLTLNYPNLPGMKADFQTENFAASIVNSIVAGKNSIVRENERIDYSLMLRGGQVRRKFGALSLGATYVNMYQTISNRDKGDSWKGTVNNYTPTPMIYAVRIKDDSPHNGDGPIIHDVKLKVDGVYRPDIQPQIILDDLRRDLTTACTNVGEKRYLDMPNRTPQLSTGTVGGSASPFTQTTINERVPKYLDYIYMNDYMHGWNTYLVTRNFDRELGEEYYKYFDPKGKPYQVNGNEYVVYLYDISSITTSVKRVQAEITVANDYNIQVAEIYTQKPMGGHATQGENYTWYESTFWKTMAQADGNVKDSSNLRTVTVDFAWEVANTIYGFDAHFNYLGFKIDGEYVTNTHHYMFSDGFPGTGWPAIERLDITPREGKHSTLSDNAYYIVAQKDWQYFGFAGEYFKMGKFYRPSMEYLYPKRGDPFRFPYNCYNDFLRVSMIADNDDDDQYPDVMTYSQVMSSNTIDRTVMDPDGVFPGNDLDKDDIPDNEKNFNGIPDYDEPFLMFDTDPDEFVFGDDFNNNNIPDFREDDMKDDTPYDLDRQGRHVNFRFTPQKNVNITLGSLRTRGVGLETRTNDDYLKLIFNYDVFAIGNFYAEYRYHEIQDNFQDSFVIVPSAATRGMGIIVSGASELGFGGSRYDRDFYYDEREYRNSKVNKFFIESKIRAIPSVTIENHVKYERNNQLEGTMYDNIFQSKDILTTFAMVNKFVYTKQFGNWTFSPGLKFRLYKKGRSESINPLDHYMIRIPIVYFKYQISPNTNITLGLQGFKGFELTYRDYIQSHNNYRKINYTLEVANKTSYFGFDIWGGFGFKLEQIKFEEEYRNFEEFKSSMLFVQIWLGY